MKKERLAGAKFVLLNSRGREVACGITNREGEIYFADLPFGKYFVKEIEAPRGFEKSDKIAEVCINFEHRTRTVEFLNKRSRGGITVVKYGEAEDKDDDDDDDCDER